MQSDGVTLEIILPSPITDSCHIYIEIVGLLVD